MVNDALNTEGMKTQQKWALIKINDPCGERFYCRRSKASEECVCIPIFKGAGWTGGNILAFNAPSDATRKYLYNTIFNFYFRCSARADLAVKKKMLYFNEKRERKPLDSTIQ